MANYLFKDRVKDSTTTTGTGNITLAGAPPTGFQSFNAGYGVGPLFFYVIESGADWEVGIGHLSASTTLVRDTVLASSNSNALVSFSAGTKNVFSDAPAYYFQPSTPSIISVGAEFTNTGVPTATLPGTHALNDILVLVLQSSNDSLIAAPTGYTQLGPQNGIGTGAAAGANRLAIFWKRDGGSETAPTLTDTGDHTYGMMFAVRGCPTTGDPFEFAGNNWKFNTSTSGSGPKSVTHIDNVLVVDIFASSIDNASAQASALTNASLTSLTEQFDDGTTDGTGGGIVVSSGIKASAGEVNATTLTWANTSIDLCSRIHFVPADAYANQNASKGAEIQIFIGSPTDLDDTWVKPTGARKVFAQVIDGGGGGSGGNTTTTAEGGGGGGGGGYDEAFFNADDLGSTVTLHAGKGGAAGTALNQGGTAGVISQFPKSSGPLSSVCRVAGLQATAAASADGGNGGSGSGSGIVSPSASTTRFDLGTVNAGVSLGRQGGRGGSGTTTNVAGSPSEWGGGGGESGADTDTGIGAGNQNGYSMRGGGGGSGGRTNTNISASGFGGGAAGVVSAQGASGNDSTILGAGGSGGVGGGSTVVTGGSGGFPGGGGGGGAGVAGGFGGRGGHGIVIVTTYF